MLEFPKYANIMHVITARNHLVIDYLSFCVLLLITRMIFFMIFGNL
jgi:hypothetical protein